MSRLLDRMLTSCERFRPSLFYDEAERLQARANGYVFEIEPVSTIEAPLSELADLPVITGDDVARYVAALGNGLEMSDLVASMAPPFDQFFVEFQRVPNHYGLHAWGMHFRTVSDPTEIAKIHSTDGAADNGLPRWVLRIGTYLEMSKGKPFGPVAGHVCGLAQDGTWFRHRDGKAYWGGGPVEMSEELRADVVQSWGDLCAQLIFPALMAISFMHCKNVSLDSVTPPEKLSRRHLQRHGRPLLSYGELRIDPIRKVLEQQRQGVGGSYEMHSIYAVGTSKLSPLMHRSWDALQAPIGGHLRCGARRVRELLLRIIASKHQVRWVEATPTQTKSRPMQNGNLRQPKTPTVQAGGWLLTIEHKTT